MNWIPKIEYIELNTAIAKTITFDSPPEGDPLGEEYKTSSTVTTSSNGTKQTQFNYIKKHYTLDFIFQSQEVKDLMLDFKNNHADRGGRFNYFQSSDEAAFETFDIEGKGVAIKRPIPNGEGDFEYDFSIAMSRVI